MTAMTGVPAQQVGVASSRVATNSKDAAKDVPRAENAEGFDTLFSRLGAEKNVPGELPAGMLANEGELQPRRPRDSRTKPLQVEDVLPVELLLTLAPQQPSMPVPVPQALPMDFAALTTLPGVPEGEASTGILPALPIPAGKTTLDAPVAQMMEGAAPPADLLSTFSSVIPSAPAAEAAFSAQAAVPPPVEQQLSSSVPATATQRFGPLASIQPQETIQPLRPSVQHSVESDRTTLTAPAMAIEPEHLGGLEGPARNAVTPAERIGEMAVTVTRQETVLAPPMHTTATQQTADRITAELATLAEEFAASETTSLRRESEPAPTRVLHIQLEPPELGALTVKLALRDNALAITVEASQPATARLLEDDKERLSEMLRSAGYGMEGVTVQISAPERPQHAFHAMMGAGSDNPAQSGSGAQSQPGGAQADAQRGHQSRRGNDEWASSSSNGNDRENAARPGSADGDLYL
jgi:chemotaxis protein MotD